MNSTTRNLIGLAASLMLAASGWATTQSLDGNAFPLGSTLTFAAIGTTCIDPTANNYACGTLAGHDGQTVGWGYTIQNLSSYWFMPTGITASGFTSGNAIPMPNPLVADIFTYPILDNGQTASVNYQYSATGSTGLFEIKWNTGLPDNTHETGFFTLSGDFYNGDPFGGGTFVGSVEISSLYDASAPEPFSILLFGTAFGVALWGKRRAAAKRPAV